LHGWEKVFKFLVAHEDKESGIDARGVCIVGGVVVGSPEWFRGFANCWKARLVV